MFWCSFITVPCSILYFFVVLHYKKYDTLLSSSSLCKSSNDMFKTILIINKCLCNLIFAYRYKTVNSSEIKAFTKTLVFTTTIVIISLFQITFDHLYTFFMLSFQKQECFYFNYDLKQHLVYIIVMVGCMLVATILQTGILILILKPICNHMNNSSRISNECIYSLIKRIFFCTFLFAASDFGLVILQLVMVKNIGRPMPILLLSNLNFNCFSFLISYGDYKKRLYRFIKNQTERPNGCFTAFKK